MSIARLRQVCDRRRAVAASRKKLTTEAERSAEAFDFARRGAGRVTLAPFSSPDRSNALAQAVAQWQNLLQFRDDARLFRQRGKRERHFC